jgi:hypothetical protein
MFGHHDDQSSQQDDNIPEESIHGALTAEDSGQPPETVPEITTAGVSPFADAGPAAAASDDGPAWQHPGTPLDDSSKITDVVSPAGGLPSPKT